MITLNLINPKESRIKYEITCFPDGEPHITLEGIDHKESVFVSCRVSNPTDLFLLLQVGDILNRHGVEFSLSIKYLMSARMDRVMSFGEAFSLKIVADAINSIHPKEVTLWEVHSERALSLIHNSTNVFNNPWLPESATVCFPDEGAYKRYKGLYPNRSAILCSKRRDPETGVLSGFEILEYLPKRGCTFKTLSEIEDIVVVDDLCDRGGTFMGISKVLRASCPKATLSIFVTHMVNYEGIDNLSAHFESVTFTDSYKDWRTIRPIPENCTIRPL